MRRRRVAILISGRGTNMAALIEAARDPSYPAEIVLVISNNPSAKGLEIAKAAGIKTQSISHKDYSIKSIFEDHILHALNESKIELIEIKLKQIQAKVNIYKALGGGWN